jgi:predicted enzyme related to lactoylglutathione lyase
MPNPVIHFEVHGSDAKKSQEFYAGEGGPTIAMFADPDGNVIGLSKADTM